MEPLEVIEKLAALVPRPRVHLTRFHGVLAPHYKYREQIVPPTKERSRVSDGSQIPVRLPTKPACRGQGYSSECSISISKSGINEWIGLLDSRLRALEVLDPSLNFPIGHLHRVLIGIDQKSLNIRRESPCLISE